MNANGKGKKVLPELTDEIQVGSLTEWQTSRRDVKCACLNANQILREVCMVMIVPESTILPPN